MPPIVCPYCGSAETTVAETDIKGEATMEKHRCSKCGKHWTEVAKPKAPKPAKLSP